MEHEGSLPYSQSPPLFSLLCQVSHMHNAKPYLFKISLVLSSDLCADLPDRLFRFGYQLQFRLHFEKRSRKLICS
jgi:hypothetical protein